MFDDVIGLSLSIYLRICVSLIFFVMSSKWNQKEPLFFRKDLLKYRFFIRTTYHCKNNKLKVKTQKCKDISRTIPPAFSGVILYNIIIPLLSKKRMSRLLIQVKIVLIKKRIIDYCISFVYAVKKLLLRLLTIYRLTILFFDWTLNLSRLI